MAGTETTVIAHEDTLNVVSGATLSEVEELERQLNPGGNREPEDDPDHPDGEGDDHPEGEGDDDQRGKVDEELEGAASDADREVIRQRRRDERQKRKSRARDRVTTLERQLAAAENSKNELAQRILQLEQTNQSTQYAALKLQEEQAAAAIDQLEAAHSTAVEAQDGKTATEAMKRLGEVKSFLEQVKNAKQSMEQAATRTPAPHLAPEVVAAARKFGAEHKWYKGPKSNDMDSRILTLVDNALLAEGWDPSDPSYWDELRDRAAKRLPHRFTTTKSSPERRESGYNAGDGAAPRQSRSPVAGSSSSSVGSGGKTVYRLSDERVRAMKEAGMWDDPIKRANMIKRYREQDAKAKQQ